MNAHNAEGPVILAAFANDRADQTRFLRNLSEEAKRIQSVLAPAQNLCPLVLLPNATLDEILSAFQTYRDRIVVFHYAGHANGFQLLLESSTGGVHRVGAKGLASFLGQQQGLQLVFLNGCSTERQAEDLLNSGVGCVIATTQAIDDGVATDFSARFYKGIVTGAPLQSAYSEAVGSAQAASGGSIDRLLIPIDDQEEVAHDAGRWPWLLKFKPGAERVAQWSLPEAAGDPLFGLPPVPQRDLPESPYRHLFRFEAEHAEVFFGRGHEIRELYQRVTASDAAPVVLFYGPSGVGKSSLLDAGLIPRLAGKNEVRYVRRDPALGLGETLRSALPKEFQKLSRREGWIAAEKAMGRPLVIVLDQVEEVFTKPLATLPHELAEFSQLLRRVFSAPDHRPQGKLILGFRKEWFAEIDELLADAQVPRSRIFLDRLSRRGAIDAITGPVDDLRLASQYKLKVEDGLPDVIADDLLADPDTPVAPTLQILLTRMWSEAIRRNREQPTFDTELYQSLHRNGILLDDFLRQQTDQIRARLHRAVDSGFLLDLLEFHTTAIGTSAEHPLTLLEQTYSEQSKSGLLSQTLSLCEEMYLLTFSRGAEEGHGRSSRLLHDTLAPLIRARHEESDSPGQRARRILDNRLVDWLNGQTGIPLDSKDLKEVEAALEGTRSWSADEQRLVTASREERASKRKWSRIFKGLGVAAVVMIAVAGAGAYWQRGVALTQAARIRSELSLSERRQAVVARDLEQEFVKSSHHFAAAAAAAATDDPQQASTMSFAAGRSIAGLKLVNMVACPDFIHEAWLMENGDLCAWSGGPGAKQDSFHRWTPMGEQTVCAEFPGISGRVLMTPSGDRFAMLTGAELSLGQLKDGKILSSQRDPWPIQGESHSAGSASRFVIWNEEWVFQVNTLEGTLEKITNGPVQGARLSASGQRALTWEEDGSVKLWKRLPEGTWEAPLSLVHRAKDLEPEFLAGSEEFLIWEGQPATTPNGDSAEVATGKHFDAEGRFVSNLQRRPEHGDPHLEMREWTHAETSQPSEFSVSLIDKSRNSIWTWRLPRTRTADALAVDVLPAYQLSVSDFISGVRLGPTRPAIAFWTNRALYLGGAELFESEVFSTRIQIPHDTQVQDAIYSSDGTTILVWTARERPSFGAYKASVGNTPGTVRVWETTTGVPLTAPVKLSKALRGAKFVQQDRGFLVWGEDGVVQQWEITAPPTSPRAFQKEVVDESPAYYEAMGKRFQEMKGRAIDPPRVKGLIQVGQGEAKTLEWGGHSGGPGQIPGGYVALWETKSKRLLTPLMRHEREVVSAVASTDGSQILTGTGGSPLDPSMRLTAHLWDASTATELMEPLVIYGGKGVARAQFEPDQNSIVVQTQYGDFERAYAYNIAVDPTLDVKDPRIDIVLRTGTSMSRLGELKFLSPQQWANIRDRKSQLTYEDWLQTVDPKP